MNPIALRTPVNQSPAPSSGGSPAFPPTTAPVETQPRTPKRTYGSGIIERCRDRFRARVRNADGTKKTLGVFNTEREAQSILDGFFEAAARSEIRVNGSTLRTFGPMFLDERETLEKRKNIRTDRGRWKNWVLTAEFADWPLSEITDVAIRKWVGWLLQQRAKDKWPGKRRKPRRVSPATVKHCLNLLRVALEKAKLLRLISTNPAERIEVPGLDEPDWDWLRLEDQQAWERCNPMPAFVKYAVMFAYGAGQRRQDQWDLKLENLHLDAQQPYMTFRMHKRQVGKKQKWVTVPLFGAALRALQTWLHLLPNELDPVVGTKKERG